MPALSVAWSFLKSPLGRGMILAILIGALWVRGNHYQHDRDTWRSAYNAQQAKFVAAQEDAEAKQIASDLATEAYYRAEAEKSDAEYRNSLASARSASERYAAAHRVRAEAACRPSGGTGTSGMPDPAPLDDNQANAPELVAVPREEFDHLTQAAVQAAVDYEYGQSLIEAGLAVPEFGSTTLPSPQ